MNIHLNIAPEILIRLVEAVEQLADDYATVHASELGISRAPIDKSIGKSYYQSDKAVYEAEQKAKLEREAELL